MRVLLGVTGSISAYRALDICRGLTKQGHQVKVVLSKGALEFVVPNTFSYLGAENVYLATDDFNTKQKLNNVLHIDLVNWCDTLTIAPASANTIAKLANGFCDDLLSCIFLALGDKTCSIFPAMNTQMLTHANTITNLEKLKNLNNIFIHPTDSGELACGEIGPGKLPKPELITEVIPLISSQTFTKTVLITTGATIAPLDPVRYLTNPSRGITGFELAKAYLNNNTKVVLVYGHNTDERIQYLKHIPNIDIIAAHTTLEMLEITKAHFDQADTYISTAAMSDITFTTNDEKLKKSKLNKQLEIGFAPDVLSSLLKIKKNQKIVGFAAETSDDAQVFKEKWLKKPVDLLVGNIVNNGAIQRESQQGFGGNSNTYYFIKNGEIESTLQLTKTELASKIMEEIND